MTLQTRNLVSQLEVMIRNAYYGNATCQTDIKALGGIEDALHLLITNARTEGKGVTNVR